MTTVGKVPLQPLDNGYQGRWLDSGYAGVPQRWLLLRSEQASHREQQTLTRNLLRESTRELKAFTRLCNRRFACQADAQAELERFDATLTLLQLTAKVVSELVFAGRAVQKRPCNLNVISTISKLTLQPAWRGWRKPGPGLGCLSLRPTITVRN